MIPNLMIDLDGTATYPKAGIIGLVQYALEKMGLKVNKRVPILSQSNKHNKKYLNTKAKKLGHLL